MPVPASRQTTRRRPGRRWAALLPLLAVASCTAGQTPPPVVDVDRGEVVSSVAATGSLVSITEQNLGFAEGGRLSEVLVEVGQRVEPGQILARLDDFALSQALEQSRAQLAQQQAALDKIRNSNSVEAAAANLDQARAVLDATRGQVDATNRAGEVAVERARVQLDFDRKSLERAEEQLREAEAACGSGGGSTSTSPSASTSPSGSPEAGSSGLGRLLGGGAEGGADSAADGGTGSTGTTPGGSTGGLMADPACQNVATAESAVQQAKGVVITSKTNLATAEQQARTEQAAGRVSIEQARTSVVTAENDLGLAGTDRPADTSAQEAMVRDAEAAVALAQNDLDAAALRAPTAGVVSEVNGATGEFLPAASGTTALAPGSSARIPDAAASGASGAGGGDAAGAAGAGGGPFIVLNDVASFQLVVPFEESDAARIQPNQEVDVTVDAVPGLTTPATVLAIAPTGRDVSGIVNYYASIVLREGDPQLRDGQTAEAAVRVEAADGVLRVPSSTVRTENGQRIVDVLGEDGEAAPVPFVPGMVGDEFTEVRSGLDEGQSVLLPQGQVAAAPGGPPQN
ncbi:MULTISPECIES: biotin/lipoyl-binding protein [unclassified Pseudonocardia]|uniref:biotin/lipoyl-binding protein n=1 Tax=unclassified Pseudonocardia TaxID=2619320 RepID=UPI00094AFD8E|nr:biotin/lipoyl-binding protein [Pseudonocardia sp. Ae707_Ps1]OLM16350.1 putative membrane fusion protein (MFP) component of efflux pump, membrane anchor protein YbhG [Pseudonocardia sp. Ae707_Ps1]